MKYAIKEVPEKWLFVVTCWGPAQGDEIVAVATRLRARARDLGYNVIYNCKKVVVRLTAIECYCIAEKLSRNGLYKPKVAIVVNKVSDTCTLYQTAGWHFGLVVSFFTDFEDAYQWVTRK